MLDHLLYAALASTALTIVVAVITHAIARWKRLPHLVWNEVAGVLVVCSAVDFKAASKNIRVGGHVFVPDVILFSANTGEVRRHIADLFPGTWSLPDQARRKDLFVPFVNERYLKFKEQRERISAFRNATVFRAKKRAANLATDFKLRCGAWAIDREGILLRIFIESAILWIAAILITGLSAVYFCWEVGQNSPVVLYTATNGRTHKLFTTPAEAAKGLMAYDDSQDDKPSKIFRGTIVKTMPIGSHLSWACIVKSDMKMLCGASPASLRVGADAFIRSGTMLLTGYPPTKLYTQRMTYWFLSRADAVALVATGKFQIVQ